MSEAISIKCVCGATHRQVISTRKHSKNDDPRLDICQACGYDFNDGTD